MGAPKQSAKGHREKQEEWVGMMEAYHEENHRLGTLLEISKKNK